MNPTPIVTFDVPLQMLQLVLVFVFLTSYALALGSFCSTRGKLRAAGIALLALVLFCSSITPWAMGIVWAALAVGSMGAFVAVTVLTSRMLGLDGRRVALPAEAGEEAPTSASPRTPRAAVSPAYTMPGSL